MPENTSVGPVGVLEGIAMMRRIFFPVALLTVGMLGIAEYASADKARPYVHAPAKPHANAPIRPVIKPWLLSPRPAAPSVNDRQRAFFYKQRLQRQSRKLERRWHHGRAGREVFDPMMKSRSELYRIQRGRRP